MLCLLAHARSASDAPLVRDVLEVVASVQADRAVEYTHLVLASLDEQIRDAVEELMKPISAEELHPLLKPAYAKGHMEGREEGREEGRAEMLLLVLDSRGVSLTDEQRARIRACEDLDQLEAWGRRVASVTSAEELFSKQ